MNNYKLVIQYDGGRYRGWQRLGNGESTIQGKIEAVLAELLREKTEIIGCSRTDAGVHALAQIANFKTPQNLTETEIKQYLNRYLPQDISITEVVAVPETFHARYNAKAKTYLYKIWNEEHANPFMRKFSMHVEQRLNIADMRQASLCFLGEHDFTAFSNVKSKTKSMIRNISYIDVGGSEGFIQIRVKGNGFLYNMVRFMVGTLIEVGLGEIAALEMTSIVDSKERHRAGRIADACGLYLEKIDY